MKGLSPLVAAVFVVVIAIVLSFAVGTFLSSVARFSTAQIESQMEQRIRCTYANFYVERAFLDCRLDCTRGVNHTVGVVVRNTGQATLEITGVYLESELGKVAEFTGAYNLSPGEVKSFQLSTLDECASVVRQVTSGDGYEHRIVRLHVVTRTCPQVSDTMDRSEINEYVMFVDCNQTQAQPSAYSILLFHFNEGSGTKVNDGSGNNNHGTIYGNYAWVS